MVLAEFMVAVHQEALMEELHKYLDLVLLLLLLPAVEEVVVTLQTVKTQELMVDLEEVRGPEMAANMEGQEVAVAVKVGEVTNLRPGLVVKAAAT